MPQGVIIGAGAVGRGFVAELLHDAGWQVIFVDVNPQLVHGINQHGSYRHITVSHDGEYVKQIGGVRAIDTTDPAAAQAIAQADLVATAVGARALPAVAPLLAAGLRRRLAASDGPLTVLLCENLHHAAECMREHLLVHLPELSEAQLHDVVGLAETSIGRMIPVPINSAQATDIRVEPYKFLPYDAAAVIGPRPTLANVIADDCVPFAFYADRKLYVHTLGHCLCAYLGHYYQDEYIWQAIARTDIRFFVRAAMVESAAALSAAFGVPMAPLLDHIDDLLYRFSNVRLADTTQRVGRDAGRKMAPGDRFLGALTMAMEQASPTGYLSFAVAVGAVRLANERSWRPGEIDTYLTQNLPTATDMPLLAAHIAALARGFDPSAQIALLNARYQPSHII